MLADIVKLGISLGEVAKTMKNEPSFKVVGVTLENARLERDDIEYLARIASKEIPCRVGYELRQGVPMIWLIREGNFCECTKF